MAAALPSARCLTDIVELPCMEFWVLKWIIVLFLSSSMCGRGGVTGIALLYLQDATVDEPLSRLRERGNLQPCLFSLNSRFYLKLDNQAVALPSTGCLTEAVELIFMAFWVFKVEYPAPLWLLYMFIEHVMSVRQAATGAVIRDIVRDLAEL